TFLYVIALRRGASTDRVAFSGLPARHDGTTLTIGQVLFEYEQDPLPPPCYPTTSNSAPSTSPTAPSATGSARTTPTSTASSSDKPDSATSEAGRIRRGSRRSSGSSGCKSHGCSALPSPSAASPLPGRARRRSRPALSP